MSKKLVILSAILFAIAYIAYFAADNYTGMHNSTSAKDETAVIKEEDTYPQIFTKDEIEGEEELERENNDKEE